MRKITLIIIHCSAVRPDQQSSAAQIDTWQGEPKDTRTEAQRHSLRKLIEQLHAAYPKALIVGHHDLNPLKDCPCFDAAAEYADLNGVRT